MIMTAGGLVAVNDLIGKKFTTVVNGKEHTSTDQGFWLTGVKQTYKVSLDNGLVIRATGNHRFLDANNEWRTIDSLSKDDVLAIQNNGPYKWIGEGNFTDGYFIGQLIGDGTFEKLKDGTNQPVVCIWVPVGTDVMNYAPAKILDNYARSLNPGPNFRGFVKQTSGSDKYDKYRIRTRSFISVADKFKIFPVEKKVPEVGSYDFTRGLISGFFDADGTIQDASGSRKSVRLSQSNLERLQSVQRLLLAMGINSKIYANRRSAGNAHHCECAEPHYPGETASAPHDGNGVMSLEPAPAYAHEIDNLTLRDALWHNRVLLLLLGLLLAMAVAVTALPAERPIPATYPTVSTTTEANRLP